MKPRLPFADKINASPTELPRGSEFKLPRNLIFSFWFFSAETLFAFNLL